jgi:hypothetical protein
MASNYFSLKEGHGHFKQGYLNFENKKLHVRFTSLFELREISIDSRVDLNNLKEDTVNGKNRAYACELDFRQIMLVIQKLDLLLRESLFLFIRVYLRHQEVVKVEP